MWVRSHYKACPPVQLPTARAYTYTPPSRQLSPARLLAAHSLTLAAASASPATRQGCGTSQPQPPAPRHLQPCGPLPRTPAGHRQQCEGGEVSAGAEQQRQAGWRRVRRTQGPRALTGRMGVGVGMGGGQPEAAAQPSAALSGWYRGSVAMRPSARMASCGGTTSGVANQPPRGPMLDTLVVAPHSASGGRPPARACSCSSASSAASAATDLASTCAPGHTRQGAGEHAHVSRSPRKPPGGRWPCCASSRTLPGAGHPTSTGLHARAGGRPRRGSMRSPAHGPWFPAADPKLQRRSGHRHALEPGSCRPASHAAQLEPPGRWLQP
jgi:hypothetical protein